MWEGIEEEIDFSTAYGIITDQPLITNEEYCRYEAAIEEPAPGDDYQKKQFSGENMPDLSTTETLNIYWMLMVYFTASGLQRSRSC